MEKTAKTLLIANPAAQSGKGANAADLAASLLREHMGTSLDVLMTEAKGHASELAARLGADYETVIALGGDGVIHEVVNGLMQIPASERPCLGVIAVGSGNDYARSLGMSEDIKTAVNQLLDAQPRAVDLGCVNGQYFTETLSFGLCAAIALGTEVRRKKTGGSGLMLYLQEGLDQLFHHLEFHPFTADVVCEDGTERQLTGEAIVFAINNGPTFGGGFKVCPEAQLDDGLLDICVARGPVSMPKATYVFLSAKDGKHVKSKIVEMLRARSLTIRFDDVPKCQIDGEGLTGEEYHVTVAAQALRVLIP